MCSCSQERSDSLKCWSLGASVRRQLIQMTADLSETLRVNHNLCVQLVSREVLGPEEIEEIQVCLHLHFYFRSRGPPPYMFVIYLSSHCQLVYESMSCDVNVHQSIRCAVKSNQFSQVIPSNTAMVRKLLDMLRYRSLWHYRGFVECVINTDNLHVFHKLPNYGRLYMHTGIHAYIHTYIHTYTHTHIHTYIHTYIHIYTHTHTHTYIHTYTHTHKHVCLHTYIHAYTHTRIHIHAYTLVRRQTDRQTGRQTDRQTFQNSAK